MSNILEIRDLKVSYGGIEAVRGIGFDVPQGKIVLIAPESTLGMSTFTVDPQKMQALYEMGYADGGKVVF